MNKRKVVSFLVAIAMVVTSLSVIVTANAAVGTHTTEVPEGFIAISTKDDMLTLMNYGIENANVEKTNNYILMADITFEATDFAEGGAFYNGGKGWAPLGIMTSYPYSGIFDGNGYTISGLIVKNSVEDEEGNCGFIGVNSGTVKNLHIKDSVMEVRASGEPNLTYATAYGGGVVGLNEGIVMNSSCTDSEVVATSITVNAYAGGIVGYNSGTINNCFVSNDKIKAVTTSNRTDRTDKAIAGGITGSNKNATMWNVMVTKDVELTVETAIEKEGNNGKGMIVGESNVLSKLDGGYYPNGTEFAGLGNSSKAVCIPLTEEQYKQSRYFGSFDFANVWEMGVKHPILRINGLVENVAPTVTDKVELPDETPKPVATLEPVETQTPVATPTLVGTLEPVETQMPATTPTPIASLAPTSIPSSQPSVKPTKKPVKVRVKFAKKVVSIKKGKKKTIKVKITGAKKATFSVDKKGKKVVKLMKKKAKSVEVKGKKKGKATITAKAGKKKATCKITVK